MPNATLEITADLISCAISGFVSVGAFIAHLLLGVFYWYKTGTFPLKERIKTNLEQLKHSEPDHPFLPLDDGL